MAFGREPVELDFAQGGLILIRGSNISSKSKISNGAGKSTLLRALVFALFGKQNKILKKDLINSEVGKECEVKVCIQIGDDTGEIIRRISSKSMEDGTLFKINNKDRRGASEKETQKNIQNFLKIEKNAFLSSVLFSVGDSTPFAGETSAHQNVIFSQMLNLSELDTARERARDLRKKLDEEINTNNNKIRIKQDIYDESIKMVHLLKKRRDEKEGSLKLQREKIKSQIDKALISSKEIDITIDTLKKTILSQEKTRGDTSLDVDIERVDISIENIDNIILNLKTDRTKTQIKQGEISGRISDIEERINMFQQLHSQSECPICSSILTTEHIYSHIDELEEKKDLQLRELEIELEKTNKLTLEIKKQEELLFDFKTKKYNYLNLEREIKDNEQKLEFILKRKEMTKKEIESLTEKLELVETYSKEDDIIQTFEDRGRETQKEISTLENINKQKLTKQRKVYAFWESGFGAEGIKNLLLNTLLPQLNNLAKSYSDILTMGELCIIFSTTDTTASGEERNRLNIQIKDKFGSNNYYASSGGERRKIDLIVSLALHSLVALKNNLGFCVMDEIFVKLDSVGKKLMLDLLYSLKDQIPTIFIISNQSDIDSEFFDKVYVVKRVGRQSSLHEEGCT